MAFDIFMQYLPSHIVIYYTKLKFLTSKIQRTAESIRFLQKPSHHNVFPTFASLSIEMTNYVQSKLF